MDSLHGRAAIGWMVVQDLVTIILIALLEPLAGGGSAAPVLFALVRAAAFLALAYIVGTRLLPWLFRTVSRLGSPELFLLSVFATALLAAFLSSAVFGLSLALGAFVAGLIVSESDLSHQAAGEIIPFRDLFAVLFFVSVGMLLDPAALVDDWPALLALLAVAVGVKAAASAGLGRVLGLPLRSALLLGATIAQVGEFSFLLAEQALHVELIDARGYNLILATAILSIVLTPTLVRGASSLAVRIEHRVAAVDPPVPGQAPTTRGELGLADEDRLGAIVVLGGGRVGRVVVRAVRARGFRCVVVDRDQRVLDELAEHGGGDAVRRRGQPGDPGAHGAGAGAPAGGGDRRPDVGAARGGAGARDQPEAHGGGQGAGTARDPRDARPGRGAARGPGGGGGPGARPGDARAHGHLRTGADGDHDGSPAASVRRPHRCKGGRRGTRTSPRRGARAQETRAAPHPRQKGSRPPKAEGSGTPGCRVSTQSRSAKYEVLNASSSHGMASGANARTSRASGVAWATPPTIRASIDQRHDRGLEPRVQPDQLAGLDEQPGLLQRLADRGLGDGLVHLEEAARLRPRPVAGLDATPEQHRLAGVRDRDGGHDEPGVDVGDEPAAGADPPLAGLRRAARPTTSCAPQLAAVA